MGVGPNCGSSTHWILPWLWNWLGCAEGVGRCSVVSRNAARGCRFPLSPFQCGFCVFRNPVPLLRACWHPRVTLAPAFRGRALGGRGTPEYLMLQIAGHRRLVVSILLAECLLQTAFFTNHDNQVHVGHHWH